MFYLIVFVKVSRNGLQLLLHVHLELQIENVSLEDILSCMCVCVLYHRSCVCVPPPFLAIPLVSAVRVLIIYMFVWSGQPYIHIYIL